MLKFIQSSKFVILLIIGILVFIQFNISRWNKAEIFEWDVKVYYAYIPAAFIYKDLHMKYFDTIPEIGNYGWYSTDSSGNRYLKVSMGVALMYLPSFAVVHTWQLITGGATDGYSAPYQRAVSLNVMLFLFLGLFSLYKILKRFYKPLVVSVTLILIVFATNLLYYASNEPGLSHVYSFSLFAFLLWLIVKWYEKPKFKIALGIGFILGLISLIRPTNLIIIIILGLYGVKSFKDFKTNINLFLKTYPQWILAILMFCVAWLPQLVYWKIVTGHYFFYTYGDEGFLFAKPEIINVLFSYRKGWFVYTPIALVAIAGIFYLNKTSNKFRLGITTYLLIHIYVVASWWCWWYGGCFGQRSMIESLAILAIPLAALINKVFEKFSWQRLALGIVIILMFILNIIQTFQYRYTIIHWDSMTKQAYWHVFLKMDKPKDIDLFLEAPDYNNKKR